MESTQVIGWMIAACVLFAVFLLFSSHIRNLAKFCINSVIGISAILIGNYIFVPMGLSVGINVITIIVAGILGLPGVVTLYIIDAII